MKRYSDFLTEAEMTPEKILKSVLGNKATITERGGTFEKVGGAATTMAKKKIEKAKQLGFVKTNNSSSMGQMGPSSNVSTYSMDVAGSNIELMFRVSIGVNPSRNELTIKATIK